MATTTKLTLAQRAKKDPKLLARVLANPGLRHKLPSSMLPPEMRQQREMNLRLSAPIVPGSTTTERDLARAANAASDVKYGDVEAANRTGFQQEQARQRDLGGPGGFYDQYLKQVAAQAGNVNTIGQQAAQAGLNAQQGITGLAGADLTGIQNPANAGAAARGVTPAGDVSGMASNAAAIRQALVGSFIATQAAQNAAASNQAGNFANVVAPTQKLAGQAMAQGQVRLAQQKIADTAKEKGAFNETYRSDRRTDEAKQVLAQQTLSANVTDKKADNTAAAEKEATKQNKYGFTTKEWNALTEKQRNDWRSGKNKVKTPAGPKEDPVYSSGPFAGKTKSYIAGLTDKQRQALVDTYNKGDTKPKSAEDQYAEDFFKKYGIKPAGAGAVNKAKGDIGRVVTWLKQGIPPDVLTTGGDVPVEGQKGKLKVPQFDPVFVRVAMDLKKYNGFISAGTADRLHRAGYSVPGLGLKTVSNTPPAPKPPLNVGGNLGGFPKP